MRSSGSIHVSSPDSATTRLPCCILTYQSNTVPFHSIRIVTVTGPSDERNFGARHRSPPGSSNFAHERLRASGARRADARPKPPPICRNPAPCHGSPGPLSKIETGISVSHVTRPVELSEIVQYLRFSALRVPPPKPAASPEVNTAVPTSSSRLRTCI